MKLSKLIIILMLPASLLAKDPFALPQKIKPMLNTFTLENISSKTALNSFNRIRTNLLSKKSFLINAPSQNKLLFYGTPNERQTVEGFLKRIDSKIQRLLIQAKILLLDQHSLLELGAFISAHSTSEPGITLIKITNQPLFDLKLSALTNSGHVRLISTPSLIVNNGNTASIASGEELPYQEKTSEGATSTTFKKALLELKVKPTVLNKHWINLKLSLHQDKPSERIINGTPAIATQQITTTTTVANKQTLILGGIFEKSQSTNHSGLPFISKMPFIGRLFQSTHQQKQDKQLMVFITTRLISQKTN